MGVEFLAICIAVIAVLTFKLHFKYATVRRHVSCHDLGQSGRELSGFENFFLISAQRCCGAFHVKESKLHAETLKKALELQQVRHPLLRAKVSADSKLATVNRLVVCDDAVVPFSSSNDPWLEVFQQQCKRQLHQHELLWKCVLVNSDTTSDNNCVVIVCASSVLCDERSIMYLVREMFQLYDRLIHGVDIDIRTLPVLPAIDTFLQHIPITRNDLHLSKRTHEQRSRVPPLLPIMNGRSQLRIIPARIDNELTYALILASRSHAVNITAGLSVALAASTLRIRSDARIAPANGTAQLRIAVDGKTVCNPVVCIIYNMRLCCSHMNEITDEHIGNFSTDVFVAVTIPAIIAKSSRQSLDCQTFKDFVQQFWLCAADTEMTIDRKIEARKVFVIARHNMDTMSSGTLQTLAENKHRPTCALRLSFHDLSQTDEASPYQLTAAFQSICGVSSEFIAVNVCIRISISLTVQAVIINGQICLTLRYDELYLSSQQIQQFLADTNRLLELATGLQMPCEQSVCY